MIVEVSGTQFIFPPRCVCCGEYPNKSKSIAATRTSGKRVVRVATNTWNVPYCNRCLEHEQFYFASLKAKRDALNWVWALLVAGALSGMLLVTSIGPIGAGIFGCLVATLAFLPFLKFSAWAKDLEERATTGRLHSCCGVSNVASFLGWSGTINTFNFESHLYAGEFMVCNQQKLVNLNPAQAAWLSSVTPVQQSGTRQRAQRYRT